MGWLILGSLVALFGLLLVWRVWSGRRKPGYLAIVEYWVYSNVQRLPPTAALLDALVSKNPHNKPGRPAITAREGVLFSDLRLHLAVAKREKNPMAFRPDLFEEHAEPSAEVLERLSDCQTLSTLRFASHVPLADHRHLQFLVHLTDTVARLTRGKVVFDTVSERFWLPEELAEALGRDNNAEREDLHVRVVWRREEEGCRATTLGLRKVGRSELTTGLQEPDEEVLITDLLTRAAIRLYRDGQASFPLEFKRDGDEFVISESGADEAGNTIVTLARRLQKG